MNNKKEENPSLPAEVTSGAVDARAVAAPPNARSSMMHFPVDARGLSLKILATVAAIFALSAGHSFFIPLVFGIFLAYTLNPVVKWLERCHVPRLIGTSLLLSVIVCGTLAGAYNLRDEFNSILKDLPIATQKISRALKTTENGEVSTFQQMQTAAAEIEKATNQVAGMRTVPKKSMTDQSVFNITQWLWAGSMGAMAFVGQALVVIFLVFFFLLSGDLFKRKIVRISGRSLSSRKITVHILDAINTSIQNYMLILLVTNVLFGLLMWGVLQLVGLENAGAWAVAAALLHVIPYFGTVLIMGAMSLAAFMQFETISSILTVSAATLVIATIIGTFVTTWMTGKMAKMNAAAVFVSLLFWTWLWGIWGMLLSIPLIFIIKVISDHVEELYAVSELLGE
ncbi:MAG: AI-2E family transporter [Oxalicibacterium faecigallinarum]|uniref:AI-2E family transporter n=1 Tax=Oxalicibacterium faecigallinarum TaxID=573741 RepID=UPI002809A69A|nr:AI-2E family transporter [Oxalicibacterium faecigallinarum]MDQ7968817.1 AI-2E family transporter [Oxalicibacterium faecigallinarum]